MEIIDSNSLKILNVKKLVTKEIFADLFARFRTPKLTKLIILCLVSILNIKIQYCNTYVFLVGIKIRHIFYLVLFMIV